MDTYGVWSLVEEGASSHSGLHLIPDNQSVPWILGPRLEPQRPYIYIKNFLRCPLKNLDRKTRQSVFFSLASWQNKYNGD